MNARDLVLTIDNGTQSLKVMVFDLSGRMQAIVRIPFEPYYSSHPGWAEQDPDLYWNTLCQACQKLWSDKEVDRQRIAGLSLTTQRGTVINVDKDGKPLRPAISWLDQRKTFGLPPVGGMWGMVFALTGLRSTVAYLQQEAEANWIRIHQPEIWNKTHKYLLLSGYLTYKLTGEFTDSVGCQVGYIPFDYKRLSWSGDSDWKWRAMPVDPDMLPKLVSPGGKLGLVSPDASRQTGLPEGLPVIAAAADKACEVMGSGSLEPSTGCISYGTTATVNVTSSKYVEPIFLLPPYPAAVPGYYSLEVQIFRGFWMVSWFKNQFGHPERQKAESLGVDAEVLFDRLIDNIPAGCMGLMLQPYWSPGVKVPGPEAKGSIIGFGDIHTRGHVYRSILEGMAYALRQGKERIEKRAKIRISELMVSGGGSKSRNAMQATADIFNLPASRPHVYETSGLGAAINGAVGLGLHADYKSAADEMTHIADVFEPDPERHKLYNALYARVYKKMYRRLEPLYREIRSITGYPE